MAEPAQPKPGVTVCELVREAGQAALASALARDGSGRPYVSLVLSACDHDGSPVLLLSDLADHSKNLASEPKASLLFDGTAGRADPLTGPRAYWRATPPATRAPPTMPASRTSGSTA